MQLLGLNKISTFITRHDDASHKIKPDGPEASVKHYSIINPLFSFKSTTVLQNSVTDRIGAYKCMISVPSHFML